VIARGFLRTLTDSAIDSSSFIVRVTRYRRPRPNGSDCTRRPEPGLCSLTDLEAVLGRRASTYHPSVPLCYQEFFLSIPESRFGIDLLRGRVSKKSHNDKSSQCRAAEFQELALHYAAFHFLCVGNADHYCPRSGRTLYQARDRQCGIIGRRIGVSGGDPYRGSGRFQYDRPRLPAK
jgi:hypothetical protein